MSNTAPFLHIAYANNDTGTLDFTTTGGIERDYTGFYTDEYATDSSDPTKYQWLTNAEFKNKVNAHVAYAESSDGTNRFTTTYPNLNLLDGTKDFSGNWGNAGPWSKNGTYNGLTVMSYNGGGNAGIYKSFTIPSDGIYSLSMLAKVETGSVGMFIIEATGVNPKFIMINPTNGKFVTQSYTSNFTAGQTILMYSRFDNSGAIVNNGMSVAGHKIEKGSTATLYMESASEIKNSNYPMFVGVYYDYSTTTSNDPAKYKWLTNADFKSKVSTAAYAKSADGKDGFTNVYPNLNLLNNSNFSSGLNGWAVNGGGNNDCKAVVTTDSDGDTCIHITGTGVACGIYRSPLPFNQNQMTIGSVFAKGTGRVFLVGLEGRQPWHFGTISTESYSKVGSTTPASSSTNVFSIYFGPINDVVDVYIKFAKLEQGSVATPYMPSITEVKDSDYPQYIGLPNVINPTTFKDYEWSLLESIPKKILNTHVAYANSSDGVTDFTTVYPNLNLLDGTKDFSGTWLGYAVTDGTYKGLTVKKMTGQRSGGFRKPFTAPKDGIYTFSIYVKSSGDNAGIYRIITKNGVTMQPNKSLGSNFDWSRDSFSVTLNAGDNIYVTYQISGSGSIPVLWNAGHKWEEGSVATPYMSSASEVKDSDYPKFVGVYYDDITTASQSPTAYKWSSIPTPGPTPPVVDNLYVLTMPTVKNINLTYGIGTLTTKPMSWSSAKPKLDVNQVLWYKSEITGTDNSVGVYYSNLVGGSNLDDGDDPLDNTVVSIVLNNKTVNVPRDLALKLELLSQTSNKRDDDLAQLIADTNDRITNIDMGSGQAGLNQEVLDRKNADDSLGLRIDTVTGNVSDLTTTTQTKFTNIEKQLGGFSVQGTKSSSLTRPSIVFNYNAYGATLPDGSSDGGGRLYYQVPGDTTYDVKELKFNYQTIPSFYDMDQITIWEDSWSKLYGGFPWRDTIVTTSDIDTFYIDGMTTYYDHNGDLVIRGKVVMDGMDDWIGSMNNRGFKPDTVVITVASDLKSVKSIRFTGDMGVIVMNISLGYGATSNVQRLGRKISFIGASPKNTLTTTGSWVNLNEKIPYGMRPINSIEISTGLLNSNNTVNYLFGSDSVIRIYQSSNNANQFQIMGQVGWETLNQYPPVNYSSNIGWNSR